MAVRSGSPTNTIPIEWNRTVHTTVILERGINGQQARKLLQPNKLITVMQKETKNIPLQQQQT